MFCSQCGRKISEEQANFCPNCGTLLAKDDPIWVRSGEDQMGDWLKKIQPTVAFIFCPEDMDTVYDMIDRLQGKGYLLASSQLTDSIHGTSKTSLKPSKKVPYIQCFGNFEIFLDGKPIKFHSKKTKELMAYIVDRYGAMCSNAEISAALWEDDKNHASYLKKMKKDLRDSLDAYGIGKIVHYDRGSIHLNTLRVKCDYYEWRNGNTSEEYAFHGEYMEQYSWAETTKGALMES